MSAILQPSNNADPLYFPSYIQNSHNDWLTGERQDHEYPYNIKAYLEMALTAGSPYANASAYDPEPDLIEMRERWEAHEAIVNSLGPESYADDIQSADELADTYFSSEKVDAQVDAFASKQRDKLYSALNGYTGGMFDVRATQSSTYQIGLALIYDSHRREVGEFRANLELQQQQMRNVFVVSIADQMSKMRMVKVEADRAVANAMDNISLKKIVGTREYYQDVLSLAEHDATYELDLFTYAHNGLGALTGFDSKNIRYDKKTSAMAAMMSGLGSAASVGMSVAAINPVAGVAAFAGMSALNALAGAAVGY